VLVKRKDMVGQNDFKAALEGEGVVDLQGLLVPRWWRVLVPAGQTRQQLMERLSLLPGVDKVEEEIEMSALSTPNDPYFGPYQWGPQKIQAPLAWDLGLGNGNTWIAVLDTGIDYDHPDRPVNLSLGYDFINGDSDPNDDNGHGTHVAGIAAAATNNGVGIAGLCPACGVLAVKVLGSDGTGYSSTIADGIEYAAYWGNYFRKKTILNLSLGSPDYSSVIADAVSYAQSLGALVVAAAGNGGPGLPGYPAALPDVIAVSATTPWDAPAYFSQYGSIGAPGGDGGTLDISDILSTLPTRYFNPPYGWNAGTSMASPHVAGVAGLVWSLFPGCAARQVGLELQGTVDEPSGWNYSYGAGRLNASRAILRFTTTVLPAATVGGYYLANIGVSGGTGSKTFTLASGALPPGLALSSSGMIEGTPREQGTFTFTVVASDSVCEALSKTFTISVVAVLPTPVSTPVPTAIATLAPTATGTPNPAVIEPPTATSTSTPTRTPRHEIFIPAIFRD